ncbi:MAG: hypothetical protein IJ189_08435 [Clostridia bacterium]|nr:hypothetical protein [Clostridia bacterium]
MTDITGVSFADDSVCFRRLFLNWKRCIFGTWTSISALFLGKGEIWEFPRGSCFTILLIVLCAWGLRRTKYGEMLYLIGANQQAAEYLGINTRAVIMRAYVLFAVSAALAGTL